MKAKAPAQAAPRQPGRVRSILLALAVHGAFFALIVFGVSWQNRPLPPLQAELWDRLPPGPTVPPKAEPEPEPAKVETPPEPAKAEPPPKAEPKPAPPPKAEAKPEPPKPDPEIAERKEREKKAREKREQEAREKAEREKKERAEKQKREEEARRKREAEEQEKKRRAAAEAKAAEEARVRAAAEAEKRAAAEAAVQARDREIKAYGDRIRDKIRGKANVPDTVRGRPEVQVRITILPGGDVLDIAIVKSSGNRVYDSAIERAIRSAQPLPVPSDPELFGQFRSLILNIQHDR